MIFYLTLTSGSGGYWANGTLLAAQRNRLNQLTAEGRLAVSWVSLWETEMLERKGRIRLNLSF